MPDFEQFFEDFDFAATTHLVTETHVLSDINALNGLNLPIGLSEIDIQSVLPLDLANDPTQNGQLVPNPSAYLYLQIVRSIYDDEELRYYDGTIRSGLCAGMVSTVADFASGESQRKPAEFGGDGRVVTLPDSPALREHIQLFQGRQLGSQVLNYLANEGTHDAVGLYAHLAARIGSPEWIRNPEMIGITKGADCADFEVGHALLPYYIDTVNGKGRIFVYDPNYPPTPLVSRAENHIIEIDFTANTWTYKLSDKAIWSAQTIYSMPLNLFRQQPILPAMTDTDVVMVNGGQRAAWGGQRAAWGGQRAAWGEVEDTGTRTGCYITPDGTIVFTRSITGSLRVFPLTGPRLPGPNGGPRMPETLFFPAGNDMTFTSAGGQETDLMLFAHQTTIGFLATADDQTIDNLDIDKTFHTVSIRTNETSSDKQFKLYQMHETKTDGPQASDTIAIAIEGNLRAGQTTTLSVSQNLENFTIVNDGGSAKPFEIGLSSIGPSAVVTVIYPEVPIGAGETWVITLPAPADLANATLTATVHRADGTIDTVPIQPATFPSASTRVRDQFDRANGELGSAWAGTTDEDSYALRDHQVRVRDGGALYWKNRRFDRTQEAFITLRGVSPRASEQGLLLKVQSRNGSIDWKSGAIKVLYNPRTHEVRVETYQPNRRWRVVKSFAGVTFASGDQLGARALSDGMVEIYRNGMQIGTADTRTTNGDFFARRGGWIGVWYAGARWATFDDFGGGTVR